MIAQELGLTRTVGFLAMPADGTRPAGVARVDRHDGHTRKLGLVLHERSKLEERPSRVPVALPLPNRCPVTNARKVFEGDTASGAFGLGDDGLADAVVLLLSEPGFLASKLLELFLGPLGPLALASLSTGLVLTSNLLDGFSGMHVAIGINRDVHDTEIDTQEVRCWRLGSLGEIDRNEEEPLTVLAKHQITLPPGEPEPLSLVLAHHEGNDHATCEGKQADLVRSLEGHHPLVERYRGVFAVFGPLVLVSLVSFDNLSDATDCHLRGKTEPLTQLGVAKLLKLELVGNPLLERNTRQPGCGLVEPFDRRHELGGVFGCGQELGLERQLHAQHCIDAFLQFQWTD